MTETVTQPEAKNETEAIRYLIHQRLKARLATQSRPLESHLDEDAICAFVEGRLAEAESAPVISHLVACSSCRQTTAQLIRFGSQFDPENDSTASEDSPERLPGFFDRLASRLAPSFDEDAVFAYHDPAAKPDQETEATAESKPGTEDDVD